MSVETIISQMEKTFSDFLSLHPHVRTADFKDVDVPLVRFYHTAITEFIWVLNPYGTHLNPIGLHPRCNLTALASIECAESAGYDFLVYHIDKSRIRRIVPASAKHLTRNLHYQTNDCVVTRSSNRERIATLSVEILNQNLDATIEITSIDESRLAATDLVALYQIALCEAVGAAHSLWVKPQAICLNGSDLYDLITCRRSVAKALRPAA